MAIVIAFSIMTIVWEDEIYTFHSSDSRLLAKLKNQSFYDYLKEDLSELKIRTTTLDYLEEDLLCSQKKIKRLQSKGWLIKLNRNVTISK